MTGVALSFDGLGTACFRWAELVEMAPASPALTDAVGESVLENTVTIAALFDAARIDPHATHATVISRDGDYTASVPVDVLRADGHLTFVVDGGTLRLTVVDGETLCWNVKDVATIRFTIGREADSVPENPPH